MLYLAVVMLERSEALPPEERAGGRQFGVAGGLPAPIASSGPWTDSQRAAVRQGIESFLALTETQAQVSGQDILCHVFLSENNWIAPFEYSTGDPEGLDSVVGKAETLYECLTDATAGHGITVGLWESI